MKFIQSHFWYTKSQRNGILFLFIILFSIQLLFYFLDFSYHKEFDDQEFAMIQSKLDSLIKEDSVKIKSKVYPFNPNFLTDFKAYQLGLRTDQIDLLFAFRKEGKYVNSAKEFQAVTGVNDSLLHLISPYFKFPNWTKQQVIEKKKIKGVYPTVLKDLNKAAIEELIEVPGVDLKMAKRIIAYRKLLQGYSTNEQLFEVYYLKRETALDLMKHFEVSEAPKLVKINVNTASFKELLQTPYLDYNLTKQICNYRDQYDFFESLDELKKIDSFPIEKFDRIALYLSAE